MKIAKIILFSLLISILINLIIVLIMMSQREEPEVPRSCDMSGIAYGIAIMYPLLMALSSLPAIGVLHPKIQSNTYLMWGFFMLVPVLFVLYSIIAFDVTILCFTLSYLLTYSLFAFKFYRRNHNYDKLKKTNF